MHFMLSLHGCLFACELPFLSPPSLSLHAAGNYAVVDVKAGRYSHLEALGVPLRTPFGLHNALGDPKNAMGHSWYGKTTCCDARFGDPWRNPCPEDLMAREDAWAYCPKRENYVRLPLSDATRAKCGLGE